MSRDTLTEPQNDVVRVQEELLEMLRMAGNEAPPPRREAPMGAQVTSPTAKAHSPAVRTCNKCGSEKPWGKSNWCPDCGYYPKTGFGGTGVVEYADEAKPPSLLEILPAWVQPVAIGSACLIVSSIFFRLAFYDALARSFLALAQMGLFAMIVMGTHCRAAYLAIQSGCGWMAFVNPGETWMLMLKKMPTSKTLIVVLGISLTGVCTSFLIGPDPDLIAKQIAKEVKGKPKMTLKDLMGALTSVSKKAFGKDFAGKNFAMATVGKIMRATGSPAGDAAADGGLEGAIGSLADTANMMTDGAASVEAPQAGEAPSETPKEEPEATAPSTPQSAPPSPVAAKPVNPLDPNVKPGETPSSSDGKPEPVVDATKETMDFWIYGYTTNPEGEIRSLLLAKTGGKGSLRYAQKLGLDGMSAEQLEEINAQLKPYRTRSAAIASPYGGKWVKPVAKCRVEHEGLSSDSRPSSPKFQRVVLP